MNNEYNKQNNGGQMNRQFNENKDNVNAQAQKPETQTCTCCEETKKGILNQAKDFATKNKTGLLIGFAVVAGTGLVIWEEKTFGLGKKLVDKIRGKKKADQPAAEAPAEEQK